MSDYPIIDYVRAGHYAGEFSDGSRFFLDRLEDGWIVTFKDSNESFDDASYKRCEQFLVDREWELSEARKIDGYRQMASLLDGVFNPKKVAA